VQFVPWCVITVTGTFILIFMLTSFRLMNGASSNSFMLWYELLPLALATGLSLAKDFLFIRWARRKLLRDFRERATRTIAPIHVPLTPPRLAAKP